MKEPNKCDYAIDIGDVYVCRMMCQPCQRVKDKLCVMENIELQMEIKFRRKG